MYSLHITQLKSGTYDFILRDPAANSVHCIPSPGSSQLPNCSGYGPHERVEFLFV